MSKYAELQSRLTAAEKEGQTVLLQIHDIEAAAHKRCDELQKERDAAQARIKELEKDSEILDWMEKHNWSPEGAVDCIYSVSIRQWVRDRAELDKLKGKS